MIHNLRQLKYPKTIVRRLINDKGWDEEELSLNTIFAIPTDKQPEGKHKILTQKVIIVHENGFNEDKLVSDIEDVAENPPVSKFGVESELEIIHRDDVNGELKDQFEDEFYLYSDGQFWDYEKKIGYEKWKTASRDMTPSSWKKHFRNGVPPIVSPIKISDDDISEWYDGEV
jgi:hypothetical protein